VVECSNSILDLTTAYGCYKKKKKKKKKTWEQADLDAVNDGLDVIGLSAQLGLPYFFCPGSDAAAHGPYGLRPHPHRLQAKSQSFSKKLAAQFCLNYAFYACVSCLSALSGHFPPDKEWFLQG